MTSRCTCRDYESSHDLEVDAFDSRERPYERGVAGGAVGINGKLDGNGSADVGGALRVPAPRGCAPGRCCGSAATSTPEGRSGASLCGDGHR